MCGIWGFVGTAGSIDVSDAWTGLCSLTDRGPDDWGMYIAGQGKIQKESAIGDETAQIVLGNRRLSILDLSPAGNQPMVAEDRYWIVYNGEVYNYQELRENLRKIGYSFESDTDTEVVLRAYQEYGPDCVEKFRGMFGFAIWDKQADQLFAARDRFGIKPLYYDANDERIAFASEVTSLLDAGVTKRKLDPVGVDGFLTFGSVPAPRTIIEGVKSLPPGSTLTFDGATGDFDTQRYWVPKFDGQNESSASRIRSLIGESVALRLRSDVPVGAFLSGGLDSSSIVAVMQDVRESDEPLHTYSIGFEEDDYSEAAVAEQVAIEFGTEHTTRTVTGSDVREHLPRIVAEMDQPTIDGVNTYFVSKLAAEDGLRVALSGLGSDELFYGYPSFRIVPKLYKAERLVTALPKPIRREIAGFSDSMGENSSLLPFFQVADILRSSAPFGGAYVAVRGIFTTSQRRRLLEGQEPTDWARKVRLSIENTLHVETVRDTVSHTELTWYMHNQLLRDTDVMSMGHSLEVRVPFLDFKLTEHLSSIRPRQKQEGEKQLLKDAMTEDLPPSVRDREKSGFTFPFEEWLRGDLTPVVERALSDDHLAQTPLDANAVRSIRDRFQTGSIHWSRLWALAVLSLWIDEHITVN